MPVAYLPIRSFGDFIITASIVKDNFNDKLPVVLPSYLAELFDAIKGDQYFNVLRRFDQAGQPAFFEFYKVRDLKNVKRLSRDVRTVYSAINADRSYRYLLDFRSRRLLFAGGNLLWPDPAENIYAGKQQVLKNAGLASLAAEKKNSNGSGDIRQILIFPDSRIPSKAIDSKLVETIPRHLPDHEVRVAAFGKDYSNFDELIKLIGSVDLVISAESLPYHLANFLGKRHFVIYNLSRHFKSSFMTPLMLENNFYSTFNGHNIDAVIRDLQQAVYEG